MATLIKTVSVFWFQSLGIFPEPFIKKKKKDYSFLILATGICFKVRGSAGTFKVTDSQLNFDWDTLAY